MQEESTESGGSLEPLEWIDGTQIAKCAGPDVVVEMDSNVLNFGQFTSGRHLRQKFTVFNESTFDKTVTIKFGSQPEFSFG